jgi:pimeloyl-ACP methyl ester carboxylesterase
VLVNTGGFIPFDRTSRLFARLLGIGWINRLIMPFLIPRYMSPQSAEDELTAARVTERAGTDEGAKVAASLWKSFLDPAYDLRTRASEIKAPTLIVWGKRDPIIPLKICHATPKAIEGSRFEVVDAGHVVFASGPEEFLGIVEPFIETISRGENT